MGFFDIFKRTQNQAVTNSLDGAFLPRGPISVSGDGALYIAVNTACIRVKAQTLSTLPGHVYRRGINTRTPVTSQIDQFFSGMWNEYMTATEGMRWITREVALYGNAYVYVDRVGRRIKGFHALSGAMVPQDDIAHKRVVYQYAGDRFIPAGNYLRDRILHFKSAILAPEGKLGIAPVQLAHEQLGLSKEMSKYYLNALVNGQAAPGWYTTDTNTFNAESAKNLQQQLRNREGTENAGRAVLLPYGVSYHTGSMSLAESDLSAQQKHVVKQICMVHGVPPYMVYEGGEEKYANAQEASLNYLKFLITPEVRNIEDVLTSYLMTTLLENDLYVKYDLNGVMRGDFATRVNAYKVLLDSGAYYPNEIRALEDMPPVDGGDYLRLDLNAARILPDGTVDVPSADKQDNRAQAMFDGIVAESRTRIKARVAKDGMTERNKRYIETETGTLATAAAIGGLDFAPENLTEGLEND